MNKNFILYIIVILTLAILTAVAYNRIKRAKKADEIENEFYKYNMERHDLETWRARGMEVAKDKNTKSMIKHADKTQLLAMLYFFYSWDLVKCK